MKLADIAKEAGVSISTVSKVMNGSSEISEDTRKRVIKIAKDNNVFEKYCHSRYSKRVIAVILPEIKSERYNKMVSVLGEIIEKNGDVAIFAESRFDKEKAVELMEYFAFRSMVDGIIVIGSGEVPKTLTVPTVVMDGEAEGSKADCVTSSSDEAVDEAIKYLKKCGHRKIGFIGERLTDSKLVKFEKIMRRHSMEIDGKYIVVSNERFEKAGFEGMERLLKHEDLPTAVIAAYDYIALGAIEALKNHGKSVPEDMSVIGMDNISAAAYSDISLTTIKVDYDEMCRAAAELIMKKIENKYYRISHNIEVKAELEIRGTVR